MFSLLTGESFENDQNMMGPIVVCSLFPLTDIQRQNYITCLYCFCCKLSHLPRHKDKKFMKKHVLHYLEKELGYTACFHERDFLVGESIPANIEAAINHSRRMIMIISRLVLVYRNIAA